MKIKNAVSTVLTLILILTILSTVASAYDGCSTESDPETQSAGDPLSYRIDNVLADDKSAFLFFYFGLAASGGWGPAADVDCDWRITALDALMLLQAAVGDIKL